MSLLKLLFFVVLLTQLNTLYAYDCLSTEEATRLGKEIEECDKEKERAAEEERKAQERKKKKRRKKLFSGGGFFEAQELEMGSNVMYQDAKTRLKNKKRKVSDGRRRSWSELHADEDSSGLGSRVEESASDTDLLPEEGGPSQKKVMATMNSLNLVLNSGEFPEVKDGILDNQWLDLDTTKNILTGGTLVSIGAVIAKYARSFNPLAIALGVGSTGAYADMTSRYHDFPGEMVELTDSELDQHVLGSLMADPKITSNALLILEYANLNICFKPSPDFEGKTDFCIAVSKL